MKFKIIKEYRDEENLINTTNFAPISKKVGDYYNIFQTSMKSIGKLSQAFFGRDPFSSLVNQFNNILGAFAPISGLFTKYIWDGKNFKKYIKPVITNKFKEIFFYELKKEEPLNKEETPKPVSKTFTNHNVFNSVQNIKNKINILEDSQPPEQPIAQSSSKLYNFISADTYLNNIKDDKSIMFEEQDFFNLKDEYTKKIENKELFIKVLNLLLKKYLQNKNYEYFEKILKGRKDKLSIDEVDKFTSIVADDYKLRTIFTSIDYNKYTVYLDKINDTKNELYYVNKLKLDYEVYSKEYKIEKELEDSNIFDDQEFKYLKETISKIKYKNISNSLEKWLSETYKKIKVKNAI